MKKTRCSWANKNQSLKHYHDAEWGKPIFNDQKLFEILTLEIFQAGLSWDLILKRRPFFVQSFNQFNIDQVSYFNQQKVEQLMTNDKIIRNRAKIEATIHNAKQLVKMHHNQQTLSFLLWNRSNGVPINQSNVKKAQLSKTVQLDLTNAGFKRVGPMTVRSFLQAAGILNDHELTCFRYHELLQFADNLMKGS